VRVFFDDSQFDFQTLRLLGSAGSGDAEAGEVLSTAARITAGDFESWTAQWLATARRVHHIAGECQERGHIVSAVQAYLRAANYYRVAEFYLHGDPADSRIRQLSRTARSCFRAALALDQRDVQTLVIPYAGTTLPGYYYPATRTSGPAATLVAHTGFDGTEEELRAIALAANVRGMHCATFEGPGQGAVVREQGLPFRPDWEAVVTPVLDHVLTLPGVDPERIALLGLSFGGYLAPRAAAFDHRLSACVANGGVFDFMANNRPAGMTRVRIALACRLVSRRAGLHPRRSRPADPLPHPGDRRRSRTRLRRPSVGAVRGTDLREDLPAVHGRGGRRGPLPGRLADAVRPAHVRLARGDTEPDDRDQWRMSPGEGTGP
jgi:hypothetical protein